MSSATTAMQDTDRMIRTLEARFERNANAHDAAALTEEFYAEGAQLLPPNSPLIKGKPAIADFWKAFLGAGVTDAILRPQDIGASGDLAWCVGAYQFSLAGVWHIGKYTVVYRRQHDGAYKAIVDAFSDNS